MNEKSINEQYIDINTIAKVKGLTSTRALRLEINKPNSKYISREIKVQGGTSYTKCMTFIKKFLKSLVFHDF